MGTMRTLEVELGERSYPIYVGHGVLERFGDDCRDRGIQGNIAVVTDEVVADLYLAVLCRGLRASGYTVVEVVIPAGEEQKTLWTADRIYERLIRAHLDRSSTVVALGGGVVGDTAGFVAATFMRGIALVQVPTTVVAQVDSSIGGKVAVDHRLGKNLIGAFHQPRLVFIDTEVLKTLPEREIRSGLVEAIKHGMIRDEGLFTFLETHIDDMVSHCAPADIVDDFILKNCAIKADVVRQDEREGGLRAILNYGHTLGHALEALTGYTRYRHGEAVALGMMAAGRIAVQKGLMEESLLDRQNALLRRVHIPSGVEEIADEAMLTQIQSDKKVREGKVRFVLPVRIGEVVVTDQVSREEILGGIEEMRREVGGVMRDA